MHQPCLGSSHPVSQFFEFFVLLYEYLNSNSQNNRTTISVFATTQLFLQQTQNRSQWIIELRAAQITKGSPTSIYLGGKLAPVGIAGMLDCVQAIEKHARCRGQHRAIRLSP